MAGQLLLSLGGCRVTEVGQLFPPADDDYQGQESTTPTCAMWTVGVKSGTQSCKNRRKDRRSVTAHGQTVQSGFNHVAEYTLPIRPLGVCIINRKGREIRPKQTRRPTLQLPAPLINTDIQVFPLISVSQAMSV